MIRRDEPSSKYQAVHSRVRATKGSAKLFACVDCARQASEWAYNGMDDAQLYDDDINCFFSLSVEFYEPMCVRCHRRHDLSAAAEELREYRRWKQRTGLTLASLA